uniref:Uncharacterized protein n=1 Tax=Ciona savignyi TaxID=51511 RepID=H2Y4T6_CIOSA
MSRYAPYDDETSVSTTEYGVRGCFKEWTTGAKGCFTKITIAIVLFIIFFVIGYSVGYVIHKCKVPLCDMCMTSYSTSSMVTVTSSNSTT